jgi:hypothetical protein
MIDMGKARLKQRRFNSTWSLACTAVVLATTFSPLFSQDAKREAGSSVAGGIRKLSGKHLTLYTDLPSTKELDELPQVFDLAVPLWAEFFGFAASELADWHVIGCEIRDKQRFRNYGLFPESLPRFLNGYQRDNNIWMYEQPSDYYIRHLLLHEGTHAVMQRLFGRGGPDWYREGMAELLGTHHYQNGDLTLGYFPANRDEVEQWGRIKIVNDQVEAGKEKSIREIIALEPRAFLEVDAYAWTWAFAAFCHRHPLLRDTFPGLQDKLRQSAHAVTRSWLATHESNRFRIDAAWNLFVRNLDYGYDLSADEIHYVDTIQALTAAPSAVSVDVSKGWQSTGLAIPPGGQFSIDASGRYQVGQAPRPWWCEPQGITIEYHRKRPLGMLIGALAEEDGYTIGDSFAIGRRRKIRTQGGGILFLRINERAAGLHDNSGSVSATMRLIP